MKNPPSSIASRHSSRPASIEPLEARIAPASVTAFTRETPSADATSGNSVVYRVSFGEAVSHLDAADFLVSTTGHLKTNGVTSVASTATAGDYLVTISALRGAGDLQLDLINNGTVTSPGGEDPIPLNHGYTGPTYHVLQTGPKVDSITGVGSLSTSANSVSWTVTFSESVTGVDAADFQALLTGLTSTSALTITGSGKTYTVTQGNLTGSNGTVQLKLVDNQTIKDAEGNPLQANPISFGNAQVGGDDNNLVALALGDVNGDGRPDLVIADSAGNQVGVHLGKANGTFEAQQNFATDQSPNGVVIADVNGDGKADLVVAAASFHSSDSTYHVVSVLLGNGDGTFQTHRDYGVNAGSNSRGVAVGDLNGDGRPDVVVLNDNEVNGNVRVLIGAGDGSFTLQDTYTIGSDPRAVVLADLNHDGLLDVITADHGTSNVSVLLGKGAGKLNEATQYTVSGSPSAIVLADFDQNGRLDLVTVSDNGGPVTYLSGNADGTFAAHSNVESVGIRNSSVAAGDFDGDGKLDFVVVGTDALGLAPLGTDGLAGIEPANNHLSVYHGNGDGTFADSLAFTPGGNQGAAVGVADLNGDGRADLAVAHGFSGTYATLLNTGAGNFSGDTFTKSVLPPDLSVTITDGKSNAAPNDTLNYQIAYANHTTQGATGVKLSIALSAATNFVAKENPGWVLANGVLTKAIPGTVAGNATGMATLKLHVNKTITGNTSGIYTQVVISDDGTHGQETNSEDNTAGDYNNFTGLVPDTTITRIVDAPFVQPGGAAPFDIFFKNIGNSSGYGKIKVTLPANTSFAMGGDNIGWVDNNDGTISMNNVAFPAGGTEQSVHVTLQVGFGSTGAPLSTVATISNVSQEINTANNSKTELTPYYSGFYVTSPGVAVGNKFAPPLIHVFDRATGLEVKSFLAYAANFRDSIRVAVGDIDNDGIDDIVTTTQHGNGRLRVFDVATGTPIADSVFSVEKPVFTARGDSGAFVAVGDVTGDGRADIVVGSSLGGGKLKYFDGRTGLASPTLYPFGANFKGGVRVAVGDVDLDPGDLKLPPPDGTAADKPRFEGFTGDIIAGMGFFGGGVKVYKGGTSTVLKSFSVGGAGYRGGVSVATADVNADGHADIIVGRNSGLPGAVEIFNGVTLARIGKPIIPFGATQPYGVRVAATDINGDGVADIIAAVGVLNHSLVKIYDGAALAMGQVKLVTDHVSVLTAYAQYPDVALWVAGSQPRFLRD